MEIEENIREKRENIISGNENTAQDKLREILKPLSKRARTLVIREEVHGDVDFSILKEEGYNMITIIHIGKGEITSITGLPQGIIEFKCIDNYLFELTGLPSSLEKLYISNNYLKTIDIGSLVKLEVLQLSYNKITSLSNLPPSLKELYIDHNLLVDINLFGLNSLKILDITENKITVVENLPENITDFRYENNPTISFHNSIVDVSKKKSNDDTNENENSYIESLSKYFELKKEYEKKVFSLKKGIYDKYAKTSMMKRRLAELKPPCIQCKRKVGSLFMNRDNRFIAKCGDTSQPCKLNIEIFRGEYQPITTMLSIFEEEINNSKEKIIQNKLDNLFDYKNEKESMINFKKLIELYNGDNELYKKHLKDHLETIFRNSTKELVEKKMAKIYETKDSIQELLLEYQSTQQREFLTKAIEKIIRDITPEMNIVRLLENEIIELNYIDNNDTYQLFRYPVVLSKLETCIGEPYRVIHFS